ncbi:MAG: sulfatase-like hydrolase/transferase [Thermoleophilaceae bacterium]|nr:sulfatase-like hydrolase/transferase [Thermoleophilaceae bacterium]
MGPNVLCVVLDTARADALEPYGAAAGASPAVADLARRGSALPHVYSTAAWTLPAHASMFTGLLPRAVGLAQAPEGTPQSARPRLEAVRERMLPEVMGRAGYETRAVSANVWVSPHCGFDIGFERFHYIEPRHQMAMQVAGRSGPRQWLGWAREGLRSENDDGAAKALEVLRGWAGERRDRPFFWFVNLIECHSPYLPPRPWNDLDALGRLRAGNDARVHQSFAGVCKTCAGRWEIPDSSLERMRHLYGRSVAYADAWLGHLLEALDGGGLLEETLVIVTSDHGENLGENRLFGHAFSLDERLTHVPLVAAGPGAPRAQAATSLADLPRMLAEAAGLEEHPYAADPVPPVAQFDPPAPAEHPRVQKYVRDLDLGEEGLERLTAVLTSACDGHRKVVHRNGRELLYDLDADPLEESPLDASAAGGHYDRLRSAIEEAERASAPTGAPAAVVPAASPEELAELERQMKLLGYM